MVLDLISDHPGEGWAIHQLKGLAVLVTAVAVVMGSVVGLRAAIAPDQPTFADAVEAAEEGDEPFLPEAEGGEFRITGDREGDFSLTGPAGPPGHGLGGSDGRMHFDGSGDDLRIIQFSYDGLDFFPDEGDCTITPGEVNDRRGIAAADIVCPDIRDIRDSATITVEGRVGLVADMVVERDLPDTGGTLLVGDETWEISNGAFLMVPENPGQGSNLWMSGERFALNFTETPDGLALDTIHYDASSNQVPVDACSVGVSQLAVVSPEVNLIEVTVRCEVVEVEGLGEVPVEGSAVVEQIIPEWAHH